MSTTTLHIEKKKTLVPKLRFREFEEEWKVKKISDIAEKVNSGKTPLGGNSVYVEEGILFIRSQNVLDSKLSFENSTFITEKINNTMKNSVVKPKDILLNITGGSLGRSCVVPKNFTIGNVNQHVCIIRLNTKNDPCFLQPIFSSEKGQNLFISLQTGSGREGLNFQSIKGITLAFPNLNEQQKIASFLSAVDEKIQQLSRKKELLELYKKGVIQQLFAGKLRFKNENGQDYPEWQEKKLREVANRVVRKNKENNLNVLTISAQLGLVSQLEYFNKPVSAKDVTNYYLLEKNDFAYNKSYSNGYPMGAIKRLKKYNKGVVSTLYLCFCFNKIVSLDFMEQYFEFGLHNKEIEKVAQEGARNHGLLNIGVNDFLNISLIIPSIQEQQKITNFLLSIDVKIENTNQQIAQAKKFKKGLLQQMFP